MLGHEDLANYFKTNFVLMQQHHYSLQDIENMLPYEKQIYVSLLMQHLQEEKEKLKASMSNG